MATTVKITCLCGKVQDTVSLQDSSPCYICHCNSCRYITGSLLYPAVRMDKEPGCLSALQRYDSTMLVSRYFCGTCGTYIFNNKHDGDTWSVSTAAIDQTGDYGSALSSGHPRTIEHEYVADSWDGGLALCFTDSKESPTRFFMQDVAGLPLKSISKSDFEQPPPIQNDQDCLQAACHCGGVTFSLSRPNDDSRTCSSPWPDLLRPYYSHDPANPEDEKWWIRDNAKFLAGTCACRTCRLTSSSPITCWTFIPRANLTVGGTPLKDFDFGTLTTYQSSVGRTRAFCKVCSASVFLRIDERPDLIDVSVGLFRASGGARAQSWFEWATDRVSFAEEALDKKLIGDCESGLQRLKLETQ